MLLKNSRYAGVLCEPVKSKTMVYNPFLMNVVKNAHSLLGKNQGAQSAKDLIANINNAFNTEDVTGINTDWQNWLENLTMTPVSVPRFSQPADYDSFIQKNHLLLTEIFSPCWDRGLGSSRHLMVGTVQMKGCGITLPVSAYNFVNGSGVYDLSLALKAFIYSGLMDSTVPLGSNNSISVQKVEWGSDKNPLGIYLRELDVPRMIQVGPELTWEELNKIRDAIRSRLGVDSAREILELFTAQLAAVVIIGGRANCTSDNILIHGEFIDEETWYWPQDLASQRMSFEFGCERGKFEWKTANLLISSCLQMYYSFRDLHKYVSFLYDSAQVPDVIEIEKMFFSHLKKAVPEWDMGVWNKALEFSHDFKTDEFQAWLKSLEKDGWSHTVEDFRDNVLGLHLSRKQSATSQLADKFNRLLRPDLWKISIKLSKLAPDEIDPDEISNMLQRLIGSSGFVLPFRFIRGKGLVENTLKFSEFLSLSFEKWPVLKSKTMDLTVWDGDTEIILRNVTANTEITKECVPLSFTVYDLGNKPYVLPSLKTIVIV